MMTRIGFMNTGKIDAVLVMFSQQGFIIKDGDFVMVEILDCTSATLKGKAVV